ncbi:ABC transporter permease [Flavobacterium polysaccharolyticum]|uniref:ABC transporter permease n=1 Tax=Flavobacterium polysaccharolyticum TaxID=3133148 RepID=A0ABU9NPB0_9FLAO
MLKNWTNIFLYHIKNNKLFTILNVLGLSIGIAGLIFAILYWNDEHSYDAWNPEREKVFKVFSDLGKEVIWTSNPATLETYLKKDSRIESFVYHDWYQAETFKYNGKVHTISKSFNTQNDFFKLFPFENKLGTITTALSKENSVAMNENTATLLFGKENPIGKQILYGTKLLTVTCVYNVPGNSSVNPAIVINQMKERLLEEKDNWGTFNQSLMIKLKDPKDKEAITKKINDLYYSHKAVREAKEEGMTIDEYVEKYGVIKTILNPLSTLRLHAVAPGAPEGKGNYQFLLIMVGLSILILLLSIVNYVNLATANAIKRAKEVGVRKIIGASKMDIIKQFIFETVVITLFSILLSLVIVELSLPYYNEFLGKKLVIFGDQFYLQLLLIFVIVIVVAGVFPAVYVSNFEALKVLKGNFGRSKSGIWLRNGMLIFQFSIASFFIIGSYIVYQQVNYLSNKDLGFKGDQVGTVYWNKSNLAVNGIVTNTIIYNKYKTLKTELENIEGVQKVSTGTFRFGGGNDSSSSFSYNGNSIQAQNMAVDYDMLSVMQIKIVKGRDLSEKLASDTINSILINETTLKMMNEKNPLGKTIDWGDKQFKVIGVVKDFNLFSPQGKVPPMVFFHLKTVDWMMENISDLYVKIDSEKSEKTISDLENFWKKKVDAEFPFEFSFVDKTFARTFEAYVKQKNLFSLLNVVVILIALFGLFALASYSIERRMKEIAIRKTLGAETNVLLKELSKQYIIYCILGFLLALFPVYYLLNMWLENFANRITISITPFIIGFFTLLALTLIVVLSRAYSATKVAVLKYLKYE